MPEEENNEKVAEGNAPVEEVSDEAKKRIKPVIEEVVSGGAQTDEATPDANEPKVHQEHEHSAHHEHEHIHEHHEEPEAPIENPIVLEESKGDIKLFIAVAVITALVVAALAGGIYVYLNGINKLSISPTPTPIPVAEEIPVPTPTASASAEVKLSTYKIQILNGSGKIGEANKAKALLEKEGFKVSATANAASFDFTDTIIEAKSSLAESVVSAAKEALEATYSVELGDALPASSSFDIVITVGSK